MKSYQVQTEMGLMPEVIQAVTATEAVRIWYARRCPHASNNNDQPTLKHRILDDGIHVLVS